MAVNPPATGEQQEPTRHTAYGRERLPFTPRTYKMIKRDCEVIGDESRKMPSWVVVEYEYLWETLSSFFVVRGSSMWEGLFR